MAEAVVAGEAVQRHAEELLAGLRREIVVRVLDRPVVLDLAHPVVRVAGGSTVARRRR